jgi:diguanylate cyclase (GGDEF)-like protein
VRRALESEPEVGGADTGSTADLGFRLHSLIEFVSLVSAARGYADLLRVMASEGRKALEASTASLSVWERERGRMRTLVNDGDLGPEELADPVEEVYSLSDHPLARRMFALGTGYVQTLGDPDGDAKVEWILRREAKNSGLALPIMFEGRIWGEFWVTRTADLPPFVESDLEFAAVVSSQVSAGIAQAEHLKRVERLAYTDDLTGLANRRGFEDRLDEALVLHRALGTPVGVIVVDVNGLKRINDRRGHVSGDRALTTFGAELSTAASGLPDTLAARLGGDEFCLLVVGASSDAVVALAQDICSRAASVLEEGVSCGVATTGDLPDAGVTPSRLLRAADAAQYRAKRSGSTVPVVAGRTGHVPADAAADEALPERRQFRGRGTTDPGQALDEVLRRLDAAEDRDPGARLVAVAEVLRESVDAASWFVSVLRAGTSTVITMQHTVVRRTEGEDYYVIDAYDIDDFPATYAALTGHCIVVDVDDPRSDPAEVSLLMLGGLSEMVMCGGADPDGDRWVLEICADELSAPVRPYTSVLRAGVALALAR